MEQRLPSLTVLTNLSSIVCVIFFLMNFAGTRAKNLSVNPEKSQGESDRQTVERCRT